MLGRNYMTFADVTLPDPTRFNISFENIETITQSEVGTELGNVTRLKKRTFSCEWNVSSRWYDRILALCGLSSGTLTFRNESIVCRPRISGGDLEPNSQYTARTDGLYTISVTFTEV